MNRPFPSHVCTGRRRQPPALQLMSAPPGVTVSPHWDHGAMKTTDQMVLLPESRDEASWELDEHTRQIGKQGLAAARQALQQAAARRAA